VSESRKLDRAADAVLAQVAVAAESSGDAGETKAVHGRDRRQAVTVSRPEHHRRHEGEGGVDMEDIGAELAHGAGHLLARGSVPDGSDGAPRIGSVGGLGDEAADDVAGLLQHATVLVEDDVRSTSGGVPVVCLEDPQRSLRSRERHSSFVHVRSVLRFADASTTVEEADTVTERTDH
jgi:hypothetical protein